MNGLDPILHLKLRRRRSCVRMTLRWIGAR